MECPHHDIPGAAFGCTYCSGKETTRVIPKPIKVQGRRKRARIDPDLVLAQRVALGEVCEHCRTETGPIGCDCTRKEFYSEQLGPGGIVREWLHDNAGAFMPAGSTDSARAIRTGEKIITGLAFSTMARASRRAGIPRDDVLDQDGRLPAISELTAQRLDLLAEFGVDPKWHAVRTQEADPLPV